jgi:hypothetical protein
MEFEFQVCCIGPIVIRVYVLGFRGLGVGCLGNSLQSWVERNTTPSINLSATALLDESLTLNLKP